MAPKTAFQKVPKRIQEWRGVCKMAGVQRKSIHSFLGMHSGSEMTQEQYLLMRVLYPRERSIAAFDPARYNLSQEIPAAVAFLNALPEFQTFLQNIRTNSAMTPHTSLGIFAIPRMNQLLIEPAAPTAATNNVLVQTTNTPISYNSRSIAAPAAMTSQPQQPCTDEEVINVCMITFLQALTGGIPNVSSEWTPQRFAFRTQFAIDRYETRTDGYLQIKDATKKIQAIIEVNRRRRRYHSPDLEMQEAAEMVGRHLLVSQTYTDAWLTFAFFDNDYVKYLKNQKSKQSFLRMQRYGPFKVTNASNMEVLSQIIVAFVMRARDGR